MLILITRPFEEALRSAAKLEDAGYSTLLSPVLYMRATETAWPQGIIDGLIATSAQAFELLDLKSEQPPPEMRRLLPLWLVGERTCGAAQRKGFDGPVHIAPHAKQLAGDIEAAVKPPARLVYLAGQDRKPDLEKRLRKAGLTIEAAEIYAAEAVEQLSDIALEALRAGEIGAAMHYSRRSAEIFLALMNKAGHDPKVFPHVCMSEDVAEPLREAGCNARCGEMTNEEGMLDALKEALRCNSEPSPPVQDSSES